MSTGIWSRNSILGFSLNRCDGTGWNLLNSIEHFISRWIQKVDKHPHQISVKEIIVFVQNSDQIQNWSWKFSCTPCISFYGYLCEFRGSELSGGHTLCTKNIVERIEIPKDVAKERYAIPFPFNWIFFFFAMLQRCLVEQSRRPGRAVLPVNPWSCQDESGHSRNDCKLLHEHSWTKHLLNSGNTHLRNQICWRGWPVTG